MAGNGSWGGPYVEMMRKASIGPGADGREWMVALAGFDDVDLLQLGPALMAGNGDVERVYEIAPSRASIGPGADGREWEDPRST